MKIARPFSLFCLSVSILSSFVSQVSLANHYESLTDEQKSTLQSGEQVVIFEDVPNELWPRSRAYQIVKATPEQAAAVVMDFNRQQEFVHRVAESIAHDTSIPSVKTVDYKMSLPSVLVAVFNPNYRLQERVTILNDGTYQLNWHLLSSESLSKLDGTAWFEGLPGGSTLLVYDNFIAPNVSNYFVKKILRSPPVMAAVKRGGGEALQTIINRIKFEINSNQPLLKQQIDKLSASLK